MEDENIIALYWQRDEDAIVLTQEQHGAACFAMANRILNSAEDSEECVNDTWLHAWRAMPPARPHSLLAEREAWAAEWKDYTPPRPDTPPQDGIVVME